MDIVTHLYKLKTVINREIDSRTKNLFAKLYVDMVTKKVYWCGCQLLVNM